MRLSALIDLQTVWSALAEVTDPEMPISIVDMGLIYDVRLDHGHVEVDMTFTAIACPAMDMLISDVREKVRELPGVASVKVNVVWNPPWNKSRLTEQGRDILQSFGVAV
jgi:metal-sulfur cluster biosynthetic enzyme